MQKSLTPDKIREAAAIEKYVYFCIDVYKACKDGYTAIKISEMIKAHKVQHDVVTAIKNLNFLKVIGHTKDIKYYWAGAMPDTSTAESILKEVRRLEINKNLTKMPSNRNLVPIIRSKQSSPELVLHLLKTMYRDHPNGIVMDPSRLNKELMLPQGLFEHMESMKHMKRSMSPGMFIWNILDPPTIEMARSVFENTRTIKNKPDLQVQPDVGYSEPVIKIYNCITAIKDRLDRRTLRSMSDVLREFNVLTCIGKTMQKFGIIERKLGVNVLDKWKWSYDGDITHALCEDMHNDLYADRKAKYFNNDNKVRKEHTVIVATKEIKKPNTIDPLSLSYIDSLRNEERRLNDIISNLPEVIKLNKIRQMIKLSTEIETSPLDRMVGQN